MESNLKIPEEFSKYLSFNSEGILCFDYYLVNKKSIWSSLLYAIPMVLIFGYFFKMLILFLSISIVLVLAAIICTIIFPKNLLLFNKKEQLLQLSYRKSGKILRTNPWNEVKMRTKTEYIAHGQISVTHGYVPIIYFDNKNTDKNIHNLTLKSRSHKELDALMHFFDDFMSNRPIKEHYYTPPGNAV